MKHTISVTVLLLCFVALMLPTYGDNALSQDWVPTTILLDENLSTSTANQILQTKDRYIWFATYDGLVRYDGTTFKTYNAYYEPSFDANSVRALFQDSKDRLWIGTNDSGLYYYMDGVFHGLERSDGFCYSMVLSIAEDQKGAIWVGGPDGLYQISITDHQTLQSDLVNNVALKDICVDCHNRIWAVTASGALKRLSESHEWLTPEELPEAQTQQIECIESVDGEIWIGGTDDRLLLCHSGQVWELMKGSDTFGLEAYTRIFADGSRYIWFCADNGIGCYDRIQNTFLDVNQGNIPIRHAVESVIQDHEGSLWISSSRSGIVKLSAGKFKNITTENGLTNEIVNAVLNVDRQLWVGTDHGLTIIENGAVVENELTALLEGERIRHMMRDSKGVIWLCTYSDLGVVCYDAGKITTINSATGLSYDMTRVALEDHFGRTWIGTKSGLNRIEEGQVTRVYNRDSGMDVDYILCLFEDASGRIFAGTDGGGIFIVEGEALQHLSDADGLSGNIILSFYEDDLGHLWAMTSNGISLIEDGGIRSIETLKTLGLGSVFQMLETDDGTVWMGTSTGVYTLKKEELLALFDGEKLSKPLKAYTVEDGMLDGITALSHSEVKDDVITFCTSKGVSILNTKSENINEVAPVIALTRVMVDDERVTDTKAFKVAADMRRIRFDFTALSYMDPRKIEFRYMLEGYDETWSHATNERTISYTNLPAGRYRFLVLGANNDGVWSEEPLSVAFEKAPYFYERPVAIACVVLLFLIAIFGLYELRMKRLREHQRELKELTRGTILCLTNAIDAKDPYTVGHSNRVAMYSLNIAREMGLSEVFCERLEYAALLHDVGKISTPDAILMKSDKLDEAEYEILKQHPVRGWHILKQSSVVEPFAYGAKYHHERYDGTGYNAGLKGKEIPLEARIIAVADAFDTMNSERPYKPIMAMETILCELKDNKGTQFDPEVVDSLLRVMQKNAL